MHKEQFKAASTRNSCTIDIVCSQNYHFTWKNKPKHSSDDSEAKYHPNKDNTSEGESSDDSLVDETEALQSTPAASSNSKVLISSI